MKLTLLQKQALQMAIAGMIGIIAIAFIFYYFIDLTLQNLILTGFGFFILTFFFYNYRLKKFISHQLKRVYDSSLFSNVPQLKNDIQNVDFEYFISGIQNFAEAKHKEIEKLHNRDDFRRDFIGDVSHELKTPLFTAQGYLLTVLDESMEDPVIKQKYLERANKSIERLSYIVKDLDMIAKLESGMKLDQQDFNLVKTIHDVFELLEIKANKKNISLGFKEPYDYPILVKADQEKIEQVLINLLSNSIKYGKLNGSTLVSIKTHSSHRIAVHVVDDGIGIDEKYLPRLFERFYRVDKSRSRDQGGSGLGLAIVKHILEAHEQEVFVKSEKGKGSSFIFTLNKTV